MKNHTKIYFNHFGYSGEDFIPCEICGSRAVDVHHINFKGMGGDPKGKKDVIDNLMALCRLHHDKCHNEKAFNEASKEIHLIFMQQN